MSEKRGEGDSDKLLLKKAVRKKIDYVKKKPNPSPVAAYNLIKDFFRAFTDKDYEYTREELVDELDKFYLEEERKLRLTEIIRKLGRVEFSRADFSKREIDEMLEDFYDAVDHMVKQETSHLNFWDKMVKRIKSHLSKHEEKEESEQEETVMSKFIKEADEEMEREPEMDEERQQLQASDRGREVQESRTEPRRESPREEEPLESLQDTYAESQVQKAKEDYNLTEEEEHGSSTVEEFESLLDTFWEDLQSGDVMMAKLDYEELKHVYDIMDDQGQRTHYEDLKKAYQELTTQL